MKLQQAPLPKRAMLGALAALLLAVRLLAPAGFMPAFDHGSVTIVACPDGYSSPPPTHHHPAKAHETCPYAAAASLHSIGGDAPLAIAAPLPGFAPAERAARTIAPLEPTNLRPFLRGPPLSA